MWTGRGRPVLSWRTAARTAHATSLTSSTRRRHFVTPAMASIWSLVTSVLDVVTTASEGVAIDGRVVRGTGEPAIDVPVTLTFYDEYSGFVCERD